MYKKAYDAVLIKVLNLDLTGQIALERLPKVSISKRKLIKFWKAI